MTTGDGTGAARDRLKKVNDTTMGERKKRNIYTYIDRNKNMDYHHSPFKTSNA